MERMDALRTRMWIGGNAGSPCPRGRVLPAAIPPGNLPLPLFLPLLEP